MWPIYTVDCLSVVKAEFINKNKYFLKNKKKHLENFKFHLIIRNLWRAVDETESSLGLCERMGNMK